MLVLCLRCFDKPCLSLPMWLEVALWIHRKRWPAPKPVGNKTKHWQKYTESLWTFWRISDCVLYLNLESEQRCESSMHCLTLPKNICGSWPICQRPKSCAKLAAASAIQPSVELRLEWRTVPLKSLGSPSQHQAQQVHQKSSYSRCLARQFCLSQWTPFIIFIDFKQEVDMCVNAKLLDIKHHWKTRMKPHALGPADCKDIMVGRDSEVKLVCGFCSDAEAKRSA